MRTYNVIISVPVELELQIEAESEDVARALLAQRVDEIGIIDALGESDYFVTDDAKVIESWELTEKENYG